MTNTVWADLFAALPWQRFAVIDGAQFDDLPGDLAAAGVRARGLYLEGPDRAAVAAGPFLAAAETAHVQSVVSALAAARPAAVLWSWPQGEAALYRHLRGVTMIDIPRDEPLPGAPSESVLFRMADPRALALVLPSLTPPQLARFMGPAGQIGLIDGQGTPRLITRPDNVESSRGRITLGLDQYDRIRQRFDAQFRAQLVTEFAPRLPMERAAAEALVSRAVDRAAAYGMIDIDDRRDFVAFYLTIGLRLDNDPALAAVRDELHDASHPPELRLFYARQEWAQLMKRRA